jgi:hypothetical protein
VRLCTVIVRSDRNFDPSSCATVAEPFTNRQSLLLIMSNIANFGVAML